MKRTMSIFLALLLMLSLGLPAACADGAASSADDIKNRKLTEEEFAVATHVIENFVALSKVPRPSHHEEKVSAFLVGWAKEQGLEPVQDEVLNVIFDVPATEGCEDYPRVGLQAHMDMVCVGDSPDYDPENDPVRVVVDYDNATMTADGTSLGADDGIGCAIIMSMVQGLAPHGPLRVIFTVDEEDGMTGIMNLDPATVADLKYLINADSEVSDSVIISTAGGVQIDISSSGEYGKAPEGSLAVKVSVSGLAGGHSGVDINKGRLNAIYVLESVLDELTKEGVFHETASMAGGTASNAIPSQAEAMLVIRPEDLEKAVSIAEEQETAWKKSAGDTEPNLKIAVTVTDQVPDKVTTDELAGKTHALLEGLVNGVYTMSEEIEGLVESSSNTGILKLTPEGLTVCCYERSSDAEKTEEILAADRKVIEDNGLSAEYFPSGDAWPYNPDSVLLPLTEKVYREQNGSDIKVEALHATLECGTFAVMNPALDMVSIGPDLENVHSTSEMLYLRTIPKTFNLLAGILAGIAEADAGTANGQ